VHLFFSFIVEWGCCGRSRGARESDGEGVVVASCVTHATVKVRRVPFASERAAAAGVSDDLTAFDPVPYPEVRALPEDVVLERVAVAEVKVEVVAPSVGKAPSDCGHAAVSDRFQGNTYGCSPVGAEVVLGAFQLPEPEVAG